MNFLKIKTIFLILSVIIVSFLFFSNCIFAYDETIVHPSLTSEMAKLYNLNYDEKISDQEIGWMKKGSKDEDDRQGLLIRSNNHFFNPFGFKKWVVNNTLIGNSVSEPKLTAKEWAHDSLEQDSFPGGDYTWERAIWDYANGDRQHAYESLGHIMHLIEDSTVPAHVRNDLHISPGDKDLAPFQNLPRFEEIKKALQEDGEPYEAWTGGQALSQILEYDFAGDLFSGGKKPMVLGSIDEYFDNIAKHTSANFFSKDTIYTYTEPNNSMVEGSEKTSDGKIAEYVYGFDENNNKIKLAKIFTDANTFQRFYGIYDDTSEVHSDYWSHLAPRAVLTGAGIIKLFKDEANKAAGNPQSIERPKSIASVYGSAAPIVRAADPAIRTVATIGQLIANAALYTAGKTLVAAQNIIISTYGNAKSSVVAVIGNAAGFLNSFTHYFIGTAEAQLEFDFSNPLPEKIYSIEDIIKQAKIAEITQAEIKASLTAGLVYDAELAILPNQKSIFAPGEEISLSGKIKNTGAAIWQGEKISLNVYMSENLANQFYHFSWLTAARPASLEKIKIAPGETGVFNFIAKAPIAAGDYFFRVRPLWQSDGGEFNWLGDDVASWPIKVRPPLAPLVSNETKKSEIEPAVEILSPEEESLPLKPNSPPEESKEPKEELHVIDENENIAEEKLKAGAAAAAEEARLKAEALLTEEEEILELRRRRTRAWMSALPETEIVEAPESLTSQTAADFKFSSTKPNSIFLCSLNGDEFAPCEENAAYEKTYENLSSGNYKLEVKAKDEFGNIDETPAEYLWAVDSLPPAEIINLAAVEGNTKGKIKLSWIKPETAVSYEIRYSEKEIMETGADGSKINWQDAAQILEAVDSSAEQIEIGSLTPLVIGKTYYFAIKSKDGLGNVSEISNSPSSNLNAQVNYVVISEVQVSTAADIDDEFIELYNPTNSDIELDDFKITKKTSGGVEDTFVSKAKFTGKIIKKHGYLLLVHKERYQGSVPPDIEWPQSYSLSSGNTIILYNAQENIIDKVGWGSALDFEGVAFAVDPSGGQSLERKANFNSDSISMISGADKYLGNGWDSDDNSLDFVLRPAANPQNSANISEPTPIYNATKGFYYATIQSAVDSAGAGDEIRVSSGTYYENVIIGTQLILKGIDTGGGKPIVDARKNESAITLAADRITLEGFVATGGGWNFAFNCEDSGIKVISGSNTLISNDVSSNSNIGIHLKISSGNNTLIGNTANFNVYGILLNGSGGNKLNNNSVAYNKFGIRLDSSHNNMIDNNNASGNTFGIHLEDSQKNTVSNNIANLSGFHGISMEDAPNNTIIGNSIGSNMSCGINVFYSSEGSSDNNNFYNNNFLDNAKQACSGAGINFWDNKIASGNYWNDYAGEDLNKDGIGDTPHILRDVHNEEMIRDNYPLMSEYEAQ